MKKFWAGLFVLAVAISACQSSAVNTPDIVVSDAWVRATGMMQDAGMQGGHGGMNTAAYMVLANQGGMADRLIRVEGDVAQAIELHRSEMVDGVMQMSPVENIEVPSNGQTELKPGGLHVMLIGVTGELKPGDMVTLVLVFEISGSITIQAEVRAP